MHPITIGIISAIISGLFTYVIANMLNTKNATSRITETLVNHEKQWHQDKPAALIEKHASTCETEFRSKVKKDLSSVVKGVSFLIIKQEGNPGEFGL